MQIRKLTSGDTLRAAELHYGVLADISSLLGLPTVLKLYQILFDDPKNHTCLGAWQKSQLVGIICVSWNMNKTQQLMHGIFSLRTYLTLATKLITLKISPRRILDRIFFERKLKQLVPRKYANIVTICVLKKIQGRGIGKTLLQKIIELCRKTQTDNLYVDTTTNNRRAIHFYKSAGFKIIARVFGGVVFKLELNALIDD